MREFNQRYDVIENHEKTKSKIILYAMRLFALLGYDTVSMRQIADELNIQASAIYNHYPSKQDILNSILDQTDELLDIYYRILQETNQKASSFEELVNNMYSELLNCTSDFIYYGLTIAQHTQFVFPRSREVYCDKYITYGHEVMKRQFDIAVENGLIRPFDTRALASFYGGSVIALTQVRVGKLNGFYEDFDLLRWFKKERDFILEMAVRLSGSVEDLGD